MTEWRKSSRSSTSENTNCVEVANLAGNIGLRDSQTPEAGHLTVSSASFADLLARVKRDELSF